MFCSLLSPPTLQIWLASRPMVQPPVCLSTTKVGPRPHFIRTEKIIRRRGIVADRAEAPDDAAGAGRLRREEEALDGIAEAALGAGAGAKDLILINHRKDGADDEIPILADGNGNDGLDVERVFLAVAVAEAEVPVRLEGNADQRRNGVAELFGELIGFVAPGFRSLARRRPVRIDLRVRKRRALGEISVPPPRHEPTLAIFIGQL